MFANLSPSVLREEKKNPQKNILWYQVPQSSKKSLQLQSMESAPEPTPNKLSNHLDLFPVCLQANAHSDFIFAYLRTYRLIGWI